MRYAIDCNDWDLEGSSVSHQGGVVEVANSTAEKQKFKLRTPPRFDSCGKNFCRITVEKNSDDLGAYILLNKAHELPLGSTSVLEFKTPSKWDLQLVVLPEHTVQIGSIKFEFIDLETLSSLCDADNDVLVITPDYPSPRNLYVSAFAHSRNQEYKANGLRVQVASIAERNWFQTSYTVNDVSVLRGGYECLKGLLAKCQYKVIVVHFVTPELMQIFDGYVPSNVKLVFICHGPETIYRRLLNIGRPYFSKPLDEVDYEKEFRFRDRYVKKYSNKDNVTWVFVSQWLKECSESDQRLTFRNAKVINNVINEDLFPYREKHKDDRKKILIIRKFDNIIQHSVDQSVRAVLELSKRPFFQDLEIEVYGDGNFYETLVSPLRQFDNVRLHQRFVRNDKISEVHERFGIMLIPSRHDTQGVAMCEGASSGLVVVSSRVTSTPDFMNEAENHTLADPESPVELADIIERLYNNPDEFLAISKRMSEEIQARCCKKKTVDKEVELIKTLLEECSEVRFPELLGPIEHPVLTIAVPAYNVEAYIDKCLVSLLSHRNAGKTEILVVNDGSKDDTSNKAKKYEVISKGIVRVIDQENGGHGETINRSLREAKGKYYRIVDGDDWVDGEELALLIDRLEDETADIVLTKGCHEYVNKADLKNLIDYDMLTEGIEYRFDDLIYKGYGFATYGPMLPTSTHKVSVLREANFILSKHKPYVDMEYNTFSLKTVNTVKYYDLDIYRYLIGREGQSVDRSVVKKRYRDHAYVIFNILKTVNDGDFPKRRVQFIYESNIAKLVDTQIYLYDLALAWSEIDGFLSKLKAYPDAYRASMDFINRQEGNSQLILAEYKTYSWNSGDPIIHKGYQNLKDKKAKEKKAPKNTPKRRLVRLMKALLPYGVSTRVSRKRKKKRAERNKTIITLT